MCILSKVKFIFYTGEDIDRDILEIQWKKLPVVSWTQYFDGKVPSKTIEFWSGVLEYQDAEGKFIFDDLAEFALQILILPFSNAVVERVFSIMNLVKTKTRSLLSLKMLEALVRIKTLVQVSNKCCNVFVPTEKMYQLFTSAMYNALHDPQYVGKRSISSDNDDELFEEAVNLLIDDDHNEDCSACMSNMGPS